MLGEFDAALQPKRKTLIGLTEEGRREVRVDLDPGQDVEFGQAAAMPGMFCSAAPGG